MELQNDFKELLKLLNKHNVSYLIVGGYALAFYGAPRYTGDIDIFIKAETENATSVLRALEDFGFGSLGLKVDSFTSTGNIIQLGTPPVRIDILTSLTGVNWDEAWENRIQGSYGEVSVNFIGKNEYIKNKRATGRARDIADIEALGEE